MRRILIIGSTGSIGTQALDVVSRSDSLEVVGLAARSSGDEVIAQVRRFGVERIALTDADAAAEAAKSFAGGEVLSGPEGLVELITETDCDMVLNALVGSAGLGPTVATLGEGIDLALANKESLVVGGELVTTLAEATGAQVIPVDSEHSALHQLIYAERPGAVDRLLLIEAHHLCGVPYERIDVLVHPQSLVHSLVQLNDGASMAHLGHPDMRVPISYALHHPERADVPVQALDLAEVGRLDFEPPDPEAFPCLRLAREAGEAGGTAPCVLNAANEVAVHAFLEDRLPFSGIARVVERALEETPTTPVGHFSDLYRADAEARELARDMLQGAATP